jgi:two-component system response regulator PilR (NtrC family)
VRELENLIERAATLCRGTRIGLDCLPAAFLEAAPGRREVMPGLPAQGTDLERLLADYERSLIAEALRRSSGIKKRAAALLGVSFRSLRYRLERLGMERDSGHGEPE